MHGVCTVAVLLCILLYDRESPRSSSYSFIKRQVARSLVDCYRRKLDPVLLSQFFKALLTRDCKELFSGEDVIGIAAYPAGGDLQSVTDRPPGP